MKNKKFLPLVILVGVVALLGILLAVPAGIGVERDYVEGIETEIVENLIRGKRDKA